MRTEAAQVTIPPRLAQLVDSLSFLTEEDVLLLSEVKAETLEAWRRRGDGPPVARFGTRYFYPRDDFAKWLSGRVRERKVVPAGAML